MLLLVNSIVLFGQNGDSLTCYTNQELLHIANRVVRAKECDTLLNLCEMKGQYKDSIIQDLNSIIKSKNTQLVKSNEIIIGKNADINALLRESSKQARKVKWLKIGWITTTGILTGLLLIVAL